MTPAKWRAYLMHCRAPAADDVTQDAADLVRHQQYIDLFRGYLPPRPGVRVLAPGAVTEAVMLARQGYEVHACVLGAGNVRWLAAARGALPLHVRECDVHDLDYPAGFFDGYFTVQVHEHLIAPHVHIGEVRYCMRDGGIVFVDACGTTNPAMYQAWHTNLVPERHVLEQWRYWGFMERWRGPDGDDRPQFVFEKLAPDHPAFTHARYVQHVMQARALAK